jgi:hypothetical protein
LLLMLWAGVILFSSTDIAGSWANASFQWLLGSPAEASSTTLHFVAQKSFHVLLFAVFGWLLARRSPSRPGLLGGVLWSFALGAVSEGMQFLFATRHPAFTDFVLNGLAGSLFFWLSIR